MKLQLKLYYPQLTIFEYDRRGLNVYLNTHSCFVVNVFSDVTIGKLALLGFGVGWCISKEEAKPTEGGNGATDGRSKEIT